MDKDIQEKVQKVFEWAGWEYNKETKLWNIKDLWELPMPDDIEFLGYMDKYVIKKLELDYDLTGITYEKHPSDCYQVWSCMLEFMKISPYKRDGDTIILALLNAVYEVVKDG